MKTLAFDPLADIFPLMEGAEFDALVASIKANGLRTPITLRGRAILDGRNRYRACQVLKINPTTTPLAPGVDPLRFVVDANINRRHLDESQRGSVAARIANMPQGQPKGKPANSPVTQGDAAAMLNVSERTVRAAAAVHKTAIPEVAALVDAGRLGVYVAADVAKLTPAKQKALVARPPAEIARTMKTQGKADKRSRREEEMAEATKAASIALKDKRYGVIYADPPWRFEPYSRETGMDRAADNHYETEEVEAICTMTVPAANDCVLFLWATAPMLPQALQVMKAWGFTYKSHVVWAKDHVGTGYWFRNKHELLLVGTKGSVPAPAPGSQYASVIEATVQEHSKKPEAFAEIIEDIFPNVPALEMFARKKRLGWDVWGSEVTHAR
jgi:N6-adenosine-specific RNA methylase IME4